jgi:hypothetical protein
VPGNDDALRAVRLFAAKMADAIVEGQQMLKEGGAEMGESGESAEPVATGAEAPRGERADRGERRDRGGRGRGDRRGGRRTTYVPPGAPPIPETLAAGAPEPGAAAPSGAGVAATVTQSDVQMSQAGHRGHHESIDGAPESAPAQTVPSASHVPGAFGREGGPSPEPDTAQAERAEATE